MRIYKYLTAAAFVMSLALPIASRAQESSINTYSPYTMYGLGNLNRSPISAFAGMGGASIGFRNGRQEAGQLDVLDQRLNVANPASLSALPKESFIFDVGLAGSNVYMRQRSADGLLRTSFNTFNFNNITIAFPIIPKLGFAFNVAPYSEVGYNIHTDDESYLGDLGVVRYFYEGGGDVTEAKASIGWEPFKNFSVGAEMNYMWGNIDRRYQASILPYTGTGTYNEISAYTNEQVARVFGAFGMQYTPIDKAKTRVTLGATYRLGGQLRSNIKDYIPSNNIYGDDVRFNEFVSPMYMPQKIGVGVYFHRPQWAFGADYVFEDWGAKNAYDEANDVRYVNTNTLKTGVKYTPNRLDNRGRIVSFFNRMTYKAGFRTGNNYLEFKGLPMNERAVTFGVDIPFKADKISSLSLGFEYGERGTMKQGLVKENYFKINAGILLFGGDHDYWFRQHQYN
jgi:hypothetical protein